MYWNERDHPVPHFHAAYDDHAAAISIDGEILGGTFPPRPLRLVPGVDDAAPRRAAG
jgi:hypothetical protein